MKDGTCSTVSPLTFISALSGMLTWLPATRNFVLAALTQRPKEEATVQNVSRHFSAPGRSSASKTASSAYSMSLMIAAVDWRAGFEKRLPLMLNWMGMPGGWSLSCIICAHRSSTTPKYRLKSTGAITQPWRRPLLTANGSVVLAPTRTAACMLSWNDWIRLRSPSGMPSLPNASQSAWRGTESYAFFRSTKTQNSFWRCSYDFSMSWRMEKMASAQPRPGRKPHWDSGSSCSATSWRRSWMRRPQTLPATSRRAMPRQLLQLVKSPFLHTHTHTHARARTCIHTHTHTHTRPCAHMHTHAHARTHTHTHTRSHTCSHTCHRRAGLSKYDFLCCSSVGLHHCKSKQEKQSLCTREAQSKHLITTTVQCTSNKNNIDYWMLSDLSVSTFKQVSKKLPLWYHLLYFLSMIASTWSTQTMVCLLIASKQVTVSSCSGPEKQVGWFGVCIKQLPLLPTSGCHAIKHLSILHRDASCRHLLNTIFIILRAPHQNTIQYSCRLGPIVGQSTDTDKWNTVDKIGETRVRTKYEALDQVKNIQTNCHFVVVASNSPQIVVKIFTYMCVYRGVWHVLYAHVRVQRSVHVERRARTERLPAHRCVGCWWRMVWRSGSTRPLHRPWPPLKHRAPGKPRKCHSWPRPDCRQ